MRIRNFTKMGEGLQWKGEDLQCCKPSMQIWRRTAKTLLWPKRFFSGSPGTLYCYMWSPLLWLGINDTLRYSNITLLLSSRKVWGADFVSKNPQFSTPTSAADVWFRVQLSLYLIIIEMILVHVSFLIHSYCKYIKDISYRLHDWHAYSTNRALSKTPRSMTLTLTLKQKISFFRTLLPPGA